jgi:hypothetical protein
MERRSFLNRLEIGTFTAFAAMPLLSNSMENSERNLVSSPLKTGEIQHMVIFDLSHEKGSAKAEKFLEDGQKILSKLPVVQNFQVLNQVSLKNDFTYGFSMVFAGQKEYTTYNNHPDHLAFVENRWKKEVTRFLEIDFKSH